MRGLRRLATETVSLAVFAVVFIVPFAFIVLTALKDENESLLLEFSLPEDVNLVENVQEVVEARDYLLVTAFQNSIVVTVSVVTGIVILGGMVGYVLQRRPGRVAGAVNLLTLAGLVIPPAVVPTIWVLQNLGLFKSLPGLVLVQIAFMLPFSVLLFRAFVASIPREIDEAALIDGCSPLSLYFRVIFPLMRPVTITVILTTSVTVFNDFVNPLYFTPGDENVTVQLTLFNYISQFSTQYNLLFTNILLITIPPLLAFIFFNRKLVDGMTAGAVKG
ncbi:MAG: carbohydrate ABC transporter permease [Dermatophilaceae bacterium]